MPMGSEGNWPRANAQQIMQKAAVTGHSLGMAVSQKNGIRSLFCLSFWVCKQMRTQETQNDGRDEMLETRDSHLSRNSKSIDVNATGSWEGRTRIST